MSQRTLSRELAGEGFTLERILDEMRRDLARSYLNDGLLTVSRVALLLGYRDVSAFSHGYRRWTGQTPGEERSSRERPNTTRERRGIAELAKQSRPFLWGGPLLAPPAP